jgi:6-pyruvoyltetrahydropterin/6-carboxytetrahydropterin synthase
MKAYLTRRYLFSSSHRLHAGDMPDAWNRETYGKCNNPHGHGHNYQLEVTVSGPVDANTGMVCNLVDLDGFVEKEIVERFGHQNLNTLPEFTNEVPTTENLCVAIYEILRRGFRHAHLEKVRMEETMMNSFAYAGGAELRD